MDAAASTLKDQFEQEVREGRMAKMLIKKARAIYGDKLRYGPQGAIPKGDGSYRAIHDGTHGPAVNPYIRIRDQLRYPRGGEARRVLEWAHTVAGAT